MCIVSPLLTFPYMQVPETKGRTLEEMDEVFGSQGLAAADEERQQAIHRRIGLDAYGFIGDEKTDDGDMKFKV